MSPIRSAIPIVALILLSSPCGLAQPAQMSQGPPPAEHGLQFVGGLGYGFYTSDTPEYTSTSGGVNGMLRVMWKPEHRLSVGLETGYMRMYDIEASGVATEFGPTDVAGSRSAVPVWLAFSMNIVRGVQVTLSSGMTIVSGSAESFGSEVTSSTVSTGFAFSLGYYTPLSDGFEWGGEVKWFHAAKYEDSGIAFQLAGRIMPFRW